MKAYGEAPSEAAGLLITARIEAGLTQRQLAELGGTSPATLAAYESGKREPRLSTLRRLLEAAGFELRLRYEPLDPAQEALTDWENALPAGVVDRWRALRAAALQTDLARAEHELRRSG